MPHWVTYIEMGMDYGVLPWILAGEVTEDGDYPYDWHERHYAYKLALSQRMKLEATRDAQKWLQKP